MDIISRTTDMYFTWAGCLSPVYVHGLLRTLFLFALPTVIVTALFARGNRSVFLQVLGCVIGVLLAMTVPVGLLDVQHRIVRGWLVALTMVLLAFLPAILAFLLVPNLGAQRKVRVGLYLLLGILLIAVLTQEGSGT